MRKAHDVSEIQIRLRKLPRELDGFSIVQLSDLDVGPTIDRGFVTHVVDQGTRWRRTSSEIGQTQLYVTRGCGSWGPNVRLLAPLEITRVILRRAP